MRVVQVGIDVQDARWLANAMDSLYRDRGMTGTYFSSDDEDRLLRLGRAVSGPVSGTHPLVRRVQEARALRGSVG